MGPQCQIIRPLFCTMDCPYSSACLPVNMHIPIWILEPIYGTSIMKLIVSFVTMEAIEPLI